MNLGQYFLGNYKFDFMDFVIYLYDMDEYQRDLCRMWLKYRTCDCSGCCSRDKTEEEMYNLIITLTKEQLNEMLIGCQTCKYNVSGSK
jgi:hypothetical protein